MRATLWECLRPRDRPTTDSSAKLFGCYQSTQGHKQVSADPCALAQMSADWFFKSYGAGQTLPSAQRHVPWSKWLFNLHHFTVQSESDREVSSAPKSIHKQPNFCNIHRSHNNNKYIKNYVKSWWMSKIDKNLTSQSWSTFTWMASNQGHLSSAAHFLR